MCNREQTFCALTNETNVDNHSKNKSDLTSRNRIEFVTAERLIIVYFPMSYEKHCLFVYKQRFVSGPFSVCFDINVILSVWYERERASTIANTQKIFLYKLSNSAWFVFVEIAIKIIINAHFSYRTCRRSFAIVAGVGLGTFSYETAVFVYVWHRRRLRFYHIFITINICYYRKMVTFQPHTLLKREGKKHLFSQIQTLFLYSQME